MKFTLTLVKNNWPKRRIYGPKSEVYSYVPKCQASGPNTANSFQAKISNNQMVVQAFEIVAASQMPKNGIVGI